MFLISKEFNCLSLGGPDYTHHIDSISRTIGDSINRLMLFMETEYTAYKTFDSYTYTKDGKIKSYRAKFTSSTTDEDYTYIITPLKELGEYYDA